MEINGIVVSKKIGQGRQAKIDEVGEDYMVKVF